MTKMRMSATKNFVLDKIMGRKSLLPEGLMRGDSCALASRASSSSQLDDDETCSLRGMLESTSFRTLVSAFIMVNVLLMGVRIQLKLVSLTQGGSYSAATWQGVEIGFTLLFLLEVLLRIFSERRVFFTGPDSAWNFIDIGLVSQSCFDILLELLHSSAMPNLSFLWTFRILRFARILRLVRVVKAFHSFRVMVYSIALSIMSMVWVWILMCFIIYGFALIFTFGVEQHLDDAALVGSDAHRELAARFGMLYLAMTTLFMAITGGVSWEVLWAMLDSMSAGYGMLLTAFVFFFLIGVMNIVTSLFVEQANQASKRDKDLTTQHEMQEEKISADHLTQFFEDADEDGSKNLSLEELTTYLEDEQVKAYLSTLGLDVSEAEALFRLLDDDDSGEVGISEFITGCSKLRGAAKSIDVNLLIHENRKLHKLVEGFVTGESARRHTELPGSQSGT